MTGETYEVLALKYGDHANRLRMENFLSDDDHASPMPLAYYVWVIRNANHTILVDTGFDHADAKARNRKLTRLPREALEVVGVRADTIKDVVISHLHYDHAGTLDHFPAATFHIQDAEVAYATGRCMCEDALRKPFSADHVCGLVRRVYSGRVKFHDGDGEIAPGVTVHAVPGHSKGLQCVRVPTARGHMVLAADAAHFYENFEKRKPFPIVVDVEATLRSYDKLQALATTPGHVIPGHDPLVAQRYPALQASMDGIAHKLDVAPRT
ncbi:MAG: N-acyl homoserine lactonase family protein [Hyphomicrobiaceae bacterium]